MFDRLLCCTGRGWQIISENHSVKLACHVHGLVLSIIETPGWTVKIARKPFSSCRMYWASKKGARLKINPHTLACIQCLRKNLDLCISKCQACRKSRTKILAVRHCSRKRRLFAAFYSTSCTSFGTMLSNGYLAVARRTIMFIIEKFLIVSFHRNSDVICISITKAIVAWFLVRISRNTRQLYVVLGRIFFSPTLCFGEIDWSGRMSSALLT